MLARTGSVHRLPDIRGIGQRLEDALAYPLYLSKVIVSAGLVPAASAKERVR